MKVELKKIEMNRRNNWRESRRSNNGSNEDNWQNNNSESTSISGLSFGSISDKNKRNSNRQNEKRGQSRSQNNDSSTSQNNYCQRNHPQKNSRHVNAKHISFKYLESLLLKPVEETMNALSENQGFYDYLEKEKLYPDTFILLISLISKFCECEFSNVRIRILQKTLTPTVLEKLMMYISSISLQDEKEKRRNSYFWKDSNEFWLNFAKISKTCLKEAPQYFVEKLSKILKIIHLNFQNIEISHDIHISDDIKKRYQKLIESVDILLEEFKEEEKVEMKSRNKCFDDREPPNNFREITVYPTTIELISDQKPFLRKNIIEGRYRDVEHYLDIQFRLLREDFVGPLRGGIQNFLFGTTKKLQDIRVHKRVQFLNPITVNHQNCVLLKFHWDNNNKSNFSYENSRRLMFGSLLCFTRDNFKSLMFGRVVERKDELLKNGELVVGFDNNLNIFYKADYVMVECNVYFEPYYHVLNVLKDMDEENFPMKQYIVEVQQIEELPEYITEITTFKMYEKGCAQIDWHPDKNSDKKFQNFNASQNAAYIAALTRKFSIIQGPPGTGKTFVGLEIAKTLLRNWAVWYKKTPMLVICYTNHALDQFLEGLLDTTKKIIRIGGQSKNENLKECNLRAQKHFFSESTLNAKTEVSKYLAEIKTITDTLNIIQKWDCVISFEVFEHVVPNFRESWLFTATKEQIEEWLFCEESNYGFNNLNQNLQNMSLEDHLEFTVDDGPSLEDQNLFDYEENIYEDMIEFNNLLEHIRIEKVRIIFSLRDMRRNLSSQRTYLKDLQEKIDQGNDDFSFDFANTSMFIDYLEHNLRFAESRFNEARGGHFRKTKFTDPRNADYIPLKERWYLYFHWLSLYQNYLIERYNTLNVRYRQSYQIYTEYKDLDNLHILKKNFVVGMTTTCAARLHTTLQMLKSPIVIVEEAAEVLEAHIVTSLTTHCQQLILVGDHQQLRPSTSNYSVETFYYLGISLFERMILNNVQCFSLNVQHRMRPEIASLITPLIYPNLKNHESVLNRPHIKGVDKFLYFIDHQQLEKRDDNNTTKKNLHEAEFLIELAKYLVLNGHEPKQVTILAAYLGQMYEIQKARNKYKTSLEGVKITVLDNYQGEESDIILLSLVRSNNEGKIGFLSIENRVCVALSRARNGFFIMGNMSHLSGKSELWNQINENLKNQDAIGPNLSLRCQIHHKATMVSHADDFFRVLEGGCDTICNYQLSCGHNCPRLCHVYDLQHLKYQCQEVCEKLLCENLLHICKNKCFMKCGPCDYKVTRTLLCGHEAKMLCSQTEILCQFISEVTLECGHSAQKFCHLDEKLVKCPLPCDTRLDCGHSCTRNCHVLNDPLHLKYKCPKPCEKPAFGCKDPDNLKHKCRKLCGEQCEKCVTLVEKKKQCSHYFNVPCHQDIETVDCKKPCRKLLDCGHKCKGFCSKECPKCEHVVVKLVPGCNHKLRVKCHMEPDRLLCNGKCPRKLSCGHICGRKCKEVCNPLYCEGMVEVSIEAECGHVIKKIPCKKYEVYKVSEKLDGLEEYCTEPCRELLDCGKDIRHVCTGTCGECYQGRIHKRCGEKCGKPLVCNHECEVNCRETCRPCQRKCTYKCRHSACKKRCGEPCTKCIENCPRKCIHQRCLKKCYEICSVPPCNEPCDKNLDCGHKCVGFCGDPCPPLCRICDKDELEEVFFGTEEDADARWVLLRDCGHVLENSGMENWLSQDSDEIKFKVCPKCKTNIITTERYGNYIKKSVQDVTKVKIKQFGEKGDILLKRMVLEEKINELIKTPVHILDFDSDGGNEKTTAPHDAVRDNLEKLLNCLRNMNRKGHIQYLSLVELNSIEIKLELIKEISDILKKGDFKRCSSSQLEFILKNITKNVNDITVTEIHDIRREINRFQRMNEFFEIISSVNFKANQNSEVLALRNEIGNVLNSKSKIIYDTYQDEDTKQKLEKLLKLTETNTKISEFEKKEIVKAIGLKQGHWYKCPNGHPYAIGECGGAMEVSKCYDCGAPIGGRNHYLITSNALAPEMDGARHAAWSNAANMANYDLGDLN